jgi:hypothetical protein
MKIVRLTETDLTRLVSKIVNEQVNDLSRKSMIAKRRKGLKLSVVENDLTKFKRKVLLEQEIKDKGLSSIENKIDVPIISNKFDEIISNMSSRDIFKLKKTFDNLGIDANSTASEVHDAIENELEGKNMASSELDEDTGNLKEKVAKILNTVGEVNIKNWGGLPLAAIIGANLPTPSFFTGLVASLGATAICYGLARALGYKDEGGDIH